MLRFDRMLIAASLAASFLVACDGDEMPEPDAGTDSGMMMADAGPPPPTDAGPDDGGPTDGGPPPPTDGGPTDGGPPPTDGGPADGGPTDGGPPPSSLVDVTIRGRVLLGNGFPQQLLPLYRAEFAAGSEMGRMQLFARFCEDAACETPIALVPAMVSGASGEGLYLFSRASPSGGGTGTQFVIPQAPAGASFMQLVGDTQRSRTGGVGTCSSISDCPGEADVIQMDGVAIGANVSGGIEFNPPTASTAVSVTAGGTVDLTDMLYMGHIYFDYDRVAGTAPADTGTLLAAMTNAADTFNNYMAVIDLDDAAAAPGAVTSDSYILQDADGDYEGDICGIIEGDRGYYAVAVNIEGARIFELDARGQQVSTTPVVTVPNPTPGEANSVPYPCRGIYRESTDGGAHLYLNYHRGAGSEDTSLPHPIVHVDLDEGSVRTPFDSELGEYAIRSLVADPTSNRLVGVDMSWSRFASNNAITVNRLVTFPVAADGALSTFATVNTTVESDETCGSTANYPSGAAVLGPRGGTQQLVVGHTGGLVVYDFSDLTTADYSLDLLDFGQLIAQIAPSPDGTRVYALPTCKTTGARSRFRLPFGASDENSDTNLVAVLDWAPTGSVFAGQLRSASTTIDIDGDGTFDHGIDMDFYRLKQYIRRFSTTLPIPPVVYVGPQIAVGSELLFVRGSGFGVTASGLGQVQDIGFFDLSTGQGAAFGDYMPFFDGLSAMAGTGTAIWGYDVHPGVESTVTALVYLPGT